MADNLTADEIRALLQLEPNATCGFVRQTYLSRYRSRRTACRRRLPTAGRWAPRSISW